MYKLYMYKTILRGFYKIETYFITLTYLPWFKYLCFIGIIFYIFFILFNIIMSIINIVDTNNQIINMIRNSNLFFNFFVNYNIVAINDSNASNPSSMSSIYNLTKGEDDSGSLSGIIGGSESINENKGNTGTVPNTTDKTLIERRGMEKFSVTMPAEPTPLERYKNMILANLSNYNLYTAQKYKFDEIVSRISAGTEPFFDSKAKELLDGDYKKVVKVLQENTLDQKNTLKNHDPACFKKIEEEVIKHPDYISTANELEKQKKKAEEAALELAKLKSKDAELSNLVKAQINEEK